MAFYFFYQDTPKSEWKLALADHREQIVRDRRPPFTTILDVDCDFTGDITAEDIAKVKYRGSLYIDFDSDSIEEVIPQFQKALVKLKEAGVALDSLGLYASGGKGFHIIVKSETFIDKVPPSGVQALPAIYKEMAMGIYVDTLDLRVYTARQGRMFRTENVKRTNGAYKVPITVAEAFEMTPEMYQDMCSAERYIPSLAPPTLAPTLALAFTQARDKVDRAVKNRKKSGADLALLKKFDGDFPPTVQAIMRGEDVAEGVGFQKIATQLAITAHAMGKSEAALLGACEGLIENHRSDGNRYNTLSKRRAELSRMFHYMADNPCYQFSAGVIKSMVAPGTACPDLNGGFEVDTPENADDAPPDYGTTLGMRVNAKGIWKKCEDTFVKVCAIGLTDPAELQDVLTGNTVGYEVNVFLDGVAKGKRMVDMGMFHSRNRFQQFTLGMGVSVQANDNQVGALADLLKAQTSKSNRKVYVTFREGVDIVRVPKGPDEPEEIDYIWASPDALVSRNRNDYRLKGLRQKGGVYRTKLYQAAPLEYSPEAEEFFDDLLTINSDRVVASVFGWAMACFLRQIFHHCYRQFPLLLVYGEAGSGKTATLHTFLRLHYYQQDVISTSAVSVRKFALDEFTAGSTSVPFVLDEYKPREMLKIQRDMVLDVLKGCYNELEIPKGNVAKETGSSELELQHGVRSSPVAFLATGVETQTEMQERSLVVPMSKDTRKGKREPFMRVQKGIDFISQLGRLCVDGALHLKIDNFMAEFQGNFDRVEASLGDLDGNDRSAYNTAVAITGLEFGRRVLSEVFGSRYDVRVADLKSSLLEVLAITEVVVKAEMSKVINILAMMSKTADDDRIRILFGTDYTLQGTPEKPTLDIKLRAAYTKYSRWCKDTNTVRLFDNEDAFIIALDSYRGTINRSCVDNDVLKDGPFTKVFRIDVNYLDGEGVEHFYEG